MFPVVILCGGLATRLRPVTETIPKSLIPIDGEPFVAHQLRLLRSRGIAEVVLCVGFLGEMIRDFAGDGSRFGLRISYSFDGPALLGTAGAIRRALPYLREIFFVLYGDSYLPCDYAQVAVAFEASGKQGLMTVYRNKGQFDSSNVEYAGGRIVRYDKRQKTPAMEYIDYGLGVLSKPVIAALPPDQPRDLASVYQDLLAVDQLAGFEVTERFYEIGSAEGIADTEAFLSGGEPEDSPPTTDTHS
ncbi:MAG TPA: nucleotidyltransferase family protein [Bryobacteraceae bacterium]|nr:nucleotidyltransferase family protein [Bryobacteraceae bacterium]